MHVPAPLQRCRCLCARKVGRCVCPAHSGVHRKCPCMGTILETGRQPLSYKEIMFPITFCYISPSHWMPSSGSQHADTEGKTSWRYSLQKEDSQLWQCKLFGCHLFPSQLLAEFTLKGAMFISLKLQRTGFPASTTQSVPEAAAAWSMLCFHLCRVAPRIFPTWDWPFDYPPPRRCPSPSRPQSTGNSTQGTKAPNRFCLQSFSQIWEKINLIVIKLFLDGWQCGRFKSIIACPCSRLSLRSDHTNAPLLTYSPH